MTPPDLIPLAPSADTNALVAERRDKLAAIRIRGVASPSDFKPKHRAAEFARKYSHLDNEALEPQALAVSVSVAGRLMLKRVMGKASIATPAGRERTDPAAGQRRRDRRRGLRPLQALRPRRYPRAEGTLFKTKTGELTVKVAKLRLLTKSLRPLPDKFHGLYDSMNKGLRLSRGTYVWFLNANDYLHPGLTAIWTSLLDVLRRSRPPILIGELQMFKETAEGIRPTRYWRAPKNIERARRFGWHPPQPAFIADRALLASNGGFDETKRIAADFKLMTKTLSTTAGQAVVFPHPLVAMREGGVSNGSVGQIL
jgi:hypothetical protein